MITGTATTEVSSYLKSYHKRQLKLLKKYLSKVKAEFKEEDIHKLRVALKKIKALYKLTEAVTNGKFDEKTHFLLFKKLFKRAGDIRSVQVNKVNVSQYILKSGIIRGYNILLKEKEKEAAKALLKSIKKFNNERLKKQRKEFNSFCKKINNKQAMQYSSLLALNEVKQIEKLKQQKRRIEVLHKIRKEMKELVEVVKLLKEVQAKLPEKNLLDNLKQTEALIGKWHDRAILIESLKSYSLKLKPGRDEKKDIEGVIGLIKEKNRAFLPKLKHKLDATLNMFLHS